MYKSEVAWLRGEEKYGTEEEGFFVADGRTGIEGTLRGPRGPKKAATDCTVSI